MFGLGQKAKEKKELKKLEKLQKKEAKVKEKLEKIGSKKKKKNGEPEKPAYKQHRYDFYVAGIEPYINHIRYDLTKYDPDYHVGLEEDEKRYKYVQIKNTGALTDDGEKISVTIGGYLVGFAPQAQLDMIRKIIAENEDLELYCHISGGEYIAKIGRSIDKGTDPYAILIIMRY